MTIDLHVHSIFSDGSQSPTELVALREWVLLAVADTGSGMDAETLRHATEPFFTTKPAGKGTGLGLASARGLVESSNGALRLRSMLGQGTTVEVFLPRADTVPNPLHDDGAARPEVDPFVGQSGGVDGVG